MPLVDCLNNYRLSIDEANSFIALAFQQNAAGVYLLPQNQRDFISESSFLKIFIAWETFLESSFLDYLLGEPSITGSIINRHAQPIDRDHAHRLLAGTKNFVDWSSPETVRKLSNLYFVQGNPIDSFISTIHTDIMDLKTVRNAAAHMSSTTSNQMDSLGTRKLKQPCNNLKVADFIFAIDPNSSTHETILTTYLTKLDIAAEGIANA